MTIDTGLIKRKKETIDKNYQTCRQKQNYSPFPHSINFIKQGKQLTRNISIKENSKIKKHLVDDIDFDEIEKMLFKKK